MSEDTSSTAEIAAEEVASSVTKLITEDTHLAMQVVTGLFVALSQAVVAEGGDVNLYKDIVIGSDAAEQHMITIHALKKGE